MNWKRKCSSYSGKVSDCIYYLVPLHVTAKFSLISIGERNTEVRASSGISKTISNHASVLLSHVLQKFNTYMYARNLSLV